MMELFFNNTPTLVCLITKEKVFILPNPLDFVFGSYLLTSLSSVFHTGFYRVNPTWGSQNHWAMSQSRGGNDPMLGVGSLLIHPPPSYAL